VNWHIVASLALDVFFPKIVTRAIVKGHVRGCDVFFVLDQMLVDGRLTNERTTFYKQFQNDVQTHGASFGLLDAFLAHVVTALETQHGVVMNETLRARERVRLAHGRRWKTVIVFTTLAIRDARSMKLAQ
jgi:hypothetical protein